MPTVPYITSDDAFMATSSSGYWADVQLRFVDPTAEPLDLVVLAVIIRVTEPSEQHGQRHVLTVTDLDDAAKRALDEDLLGPTYAGYLAQRDVDGPTLDAVIQVACFDGKVLFG